MSSYPEKKRKRVTTRKKPSLDNKKKPPLVLPNPWLPDDLLISCFARVSISYYPTLSLVSKSFGSLIASPELYKTRSSLGHTESCLYVCLGFLPPEPIPRWFTPIPRWFTLCRKPDRFLTTKKKKKKKPSRYVLAKLPTPHPGPTGYWSPVVKIGSIGSKVVYVEGAFRWYDTKVSLWRALKGVKGLPKFPRDCPRLVDYGGKMAVLWHRGVASSGFEEKIIWCAVIALERRNDEEIWGKVEWQEAVLTVPKSCRFQYALATTL